MSRLAPDVPRTPLSELAERVRSTSAAQFVVALVPGLPEETRRDLADLLAGRLTAPSPAQLREAQIGLLVELIERANGILPSADLYQEERERRAAAGEAGWPGAEAVGDAYGDWIAACSAAWRLWHAGGVARVPHTYRHAIAYSRLQRRDAIRAIQRFRSQMGHWPTQWEYDTWARIERRTARLTGQDNPRLPSLPRVAQVATSWERALSLAVRDW